MGKVFERKVVVVTGGTWLLRSPALLSISVLWSSGVSTNTVTVVAPARDGDTDADGLPNGWESDYGLDPLTSDAGADPDGDGRTNQQEYQQGTHPRGFVITYFAEGATGSFFDTVIAVANPTATRALV
jgi:hypothetical protein